MRKLIMFLIFALTATCIYADQLSKESEITITDLKGVNLISLDFVNGSCEIVGKKTGRVEIKAKIKVSGKNEATVEEALKNAELTVKKSGDSLDISLNYDKLRKYTGQCGGFWDFFSTVNNKVNISVNLKIIVPSHFSLELDGVNFDLSVKNLNKIDVSTVNGNVVAENIKKADCESVNGNIKIYNVIYKVNCEVVNGNLTVNTNSEELTDIVLESINGNADIIVPEKAVAKIETSSLTSKTVLKRGEDIVRGKNLSWQGKGDCDINVETINGTINIVLK